MLSRHHLWIHVIMTLCGPVVVLTFSWCRSHWFASGRACNWLEWLTPGGQDPQKHIYETKW